MIPYASFVLEHRGMDRERFLQRVDVPYLLLDAAPEPEARGGGGIMTVKFTHEALEEARGRVTQASLLPVRKREGSNAFAMMITLGRAPNNDLVIPDKRISKFHAYFRQVGDRWTVCDANSRNGTYVDGARVPSEGGLDLRSGARIKLAQALELVFLDPSDLYARVSG